MNRHANLADFFMAGCAILPLPLLLTFGPLAAFGAMALLLVLGCYHGAMEQVETSDGPLIGDGLDRNQQPSDGREPGLRGLAPALRPALKGDEERRRQPDDRRQRAEEDTGDRDAHARARDDAGGAHVPGGTTDGRLDGADHGFGR